MNSPQVIHLNNMAERFIIFYCFTEHMTENEIFQIIQIIQVIQYRNIIKGKK